MFDWFTPKLPVDASMKRWLEARMGWLLGQFDKSRTLQASMILPNDKFFPEPYDGSEEAGRILFERTCRYVNFDSDCVELKFYRPERKRRFNINLIPPRPNWAGLYGNHFETRETILVDQALLEDPVGLVATFSHELAHAILLGEKRLSLELPDMERITDLATVVLGMGIFNANASLRTTHYTSLRIHYTHTSRLGYLSPDSFGYALALLTWLREEKKPFWIKYLGSSIRGPFKQGLAYLQKTGDARIIPGEPLESISLEELFPTPEKDTQESQFDKQYDEELTAGIHCKTPEDRYYTEGLFFAEEDRWEEAVCAYTKAIECNSKEGDFYQERAWAFLELDRITMALADAEKAVELLPEEPGAWLVRGVAYSESAQYDRAILDLNKYIEEEDGYTRNEVSSSKAYYFRGLAHSGSKNYERAIRDFSKAIIRWPNWPEPYLARADAYELLGKFQKAAADRKEASRRPLID